jgi:ketosteroid isomerase-like protein
MLTSFEAEDLEAWEERQLDPQGFPHINDLVVVLMHEYRCGRGRGIEVETDTAVVFTVREGRVIRIQPYMDQAAALEAAGRSE